MDEALWKKALQALPPELHERVRERNRELFANSSSLYPQPRQLPDMRAQIMKADSVARTAGRCMSVETDVPVMSKLVLIAARSADLWWCSRDVKELVDNASATMPPQPLAVDDPPSPSGLMFMEAPFIDDDGWDTSGKVATNAFLWFTGYSRAKEGDGSGRVLHVVSLSWCGPSIGWIAPGVETWPVGETQDDTECESDRADRARIATVWTIARQERLVPQCSVVPGRPALRRVVAAGLPPESGTVRTLDIRRPSGGGTSGSEGRDYSHRWIVNGHWRNQWLPSRKTHRAQWIAPYVKGPEDKPLIVREDVRVVR